MTQLRFSGHETFHCRHFWLKKGVDFMDKQRDFKDADSVVELGVGKNMVSSINHWLKSFGLRQNEDAKLSDLGQFLFGVEGLDPYIENIGTVWLLHYQLQREEYASIFGIAFNEFRKSRVAFDFTAAQLSNFLVKACRQNGQSFSENSIKNDVRVFLRSYLPPLRTSKSLEDDLSALFIDLRLLSEVEGVRENGEQVYRFNYGQHSTLPPLIFLYAILDLFGDRKSISFGEVQLGISDKFLCNQDQTMKLIEELERKKLLVFKQDAGRKEIQLKAKHSSFNVLTKYYG